MSITFLYGWFQFEAKLDLHFLSSMDNDCWAKNFSSSFSSFRKTSRVIHQHLLSWLEHEAHFFLTSWCWVVKQNTVKCMEQQLGHHSPQVLCLFEQVGVAVDSFVPLFLFCFFLDPIAPVPFLFCWRAYLLHPKNICCPPAGQINLFFGCSSTLLDTKVVTSKEAALLFLRGCQRMVAIQKSLKVHGRRGLNYTIQNEARSDFRRFTKGQIFNPATRTYLLVRCSVSRCDTRASLCDIWYIRWPIVFLISSYIPGAFQS